MKCKIDKYKKHMTTICCEYLEATTTTQTSNIQDPLQRRAIEVAINVAKNEVWIVTLLKLLLKPKFWFIYSRKFLVCVNPTRLKYVTINWLDQNVLENDYKYNEKNDNKLKYKVILTRNKMFWVMINLRHNGKTIL